MASIAGSFLACGRQRTDMSFLQRSAASCGEDQCCTVAVGMLSSKGMRSLPRSGSSAASSMFPLCNVRLNVNQIPQDGIAHRILLIDDDTALPSHHAPKGLVTDTAANHLSAVTGAG